MLLVFLVALACLATVSAQTCTLGTTMSCDLNIANGLALQIRSEYEARTGVTFVQWDTTWIKCANDKCSGWLQAPAAAALRATAMDEGVPIEIIADWRSSAQGYLRHRWVNGINNGGMCRANKDSPTGDGQGSVPGHDYHAAGRVVTVKTAVAGHWKKALKAHGFHMPKPNEDDNYFEYLQHQEGESKIELAPAEVRAFQTLWNRNSPPEQRIKVNGQFDGPTQMAYSQAPCGGW